jgi:hypothetical protein
MVAFWRKLHNRIVLSLQPKRGDDFMKSAALSVVACLAFGTPSLGLAQDLKATQRLAGTHIGFDAGATYSNYTLTVTGPNGFHAVAASKTGAPSIDLRRIGAFDDGTYHYELIAATDLKVPVRSTLDNGRKGGPDASAGSVAVRSVSTGGVFTVKGGAITKPDPAAREDVKRQK